MSDPVKIIQNGISQAAAITETVITELTEWVEIVESASVTAPILPSVDESPPFIALSRPSDAQSMNPLWNTRIKLIQNLVAKIERARSQQEIPSMPPLVPLQDTHPLPSAASPTAETASSKKTNSEPATPTKAEATQEEGSSWGKTVLIGGGLGLGIGAVVVYGKAYLIGTGLTLAGQTVTRAGLPALGTTVSNVLARTAVSEGTGTVVALALREQAMGGIMRYLGGARGLAMSLTSLAVGVTESAIAIFESSGTLSPAVNEADYPPDPTDGPEKVSETDSDTDADTDGEDRYTAIRSWLAGPPLQMEDVGISFGSDINHVTGSLLQHFADLDDSQFTQALEALKQITDDQNSILTSIYSSRALNNSSSLQNLKINLFCGSVNRSTRDDMFYDLKSKRDALVRIRDIDSKASSQFEFWNHFLNDTEIFRDLIEIVEHDDSDPRELWSLLCQVDWSFEKLFEMYEESDRSLGSVPKLIRNIFNDMVSPQDFPMLLLKTKEALVDHYILLVENEIGMVLADNLYQRSAARIEAFQNSRDLLRTRRTWKLLVDSIHEQTILDALQEVDLVNRYPKEWDKLKRMIERQPASDDRPREWYKKITLFELNYIRNEFDIDRILRLVRLERINNFDELLEHMKNT